MPSHGASVNAKAGRAGIVAVFPSDPTPAEQIAAFLPGRDHEVPDFHLVREFPQEVDPLGGVRAEPPIDQFLVNLLAGPSQIAASVPAYRCDAVLDHAGPHALSADVHVHQPPTPVPKPVLEPRVGLLVVPKLDIRRVVEVNLRIVGCSFKAVPNLQNRFVDGDRVGSVPSAEADDLLLVTAGNDRLESVREDQVEKGVPENAIVGELGGVKPGSELPRFPGQDVPAISIQREPVDHRDHKEAVLFPRELVVGPTHVDDPRSEYGVSQEIMLPRDVFPRPAPDLANTLQLRVGCQCPPVDDQVVQPGHFGPEALDFLRPRAELAFEFGLKGVRRSIVKMFYIQSSQVLKVLACPQ